MQECPSEAIDEGDEEEGEKCSFQFAVLTFVETILAQGDHFAKPHNGMGHPPWVTKKEVKNPTYQQG